MTTGQLLSSLSTVSNVSALTHLQNIDCQGGADTIYNIYSGRLEVSSVDEVLEINLQQPLYSISLEQKIYEININKKENDIILNKNNLELDKSCIVQSNTDILP